MKKHAANNIGSRMASTEDDDNDLVSGEDGESASATDIDSDDLEEMISRTDVSHALSQQQDFVEF